MKYYYPRFVVGNYIEIEEIHKGENKEKYAVSCKWKVVGDYPTFIVCERPGERDKNVTIRTTFSKFDLEKWLDCRVVA